MARKMSQILAVEKTIKSKREDEFTQLYRQVQNAEAVVGRVKTYQPKDEDGERLPTESQRVALKVEEAIQRVVGSMTEVFNITAVKDVTNTMAVADVLIDNAVVLRSVPATHLLWLEKKLATLNDFINKLPTLSPDLAWTFDAGQGLYRSEPAEAAKMKKLEEFVTVAPATKEHPAQVQKVTKDVIVGTTTTTHLSGAIPVDRKKRLQERIEVVLRAVKEARETANQVTAAEATSASLLDYIFKP